MASGEMTEDEFTRFLNETLALVGSYAAGGTIVYACMDWRHMGEMLAAGGAAGFDLLNLCVWVKSNGGMGSLYRSRHELVFALPVILESQDDMSGQWRNNRAENSHQPTRR